MLCGVKIMKVKAYWKNKNPFHPDISQFGYTKTVDVPDDTDLADIEKFAKDDCRNGYRFDKIEVIEPNAHNATYMVYGVKGFAYHVTSRKNLKSIKSKGLEPRVSTDYGDNGGAKAVYLFKTEDDTKTALSQWLGERICDWEEENDTEYDEIVLKINITGLDEYLIDTVDYEWTCLIHIDPSRIVDVLVM